jgi:septum site-determining protein MinC
MKNGINLILDPNLSFHDLLERIAEKFKESGKFFGKSRLALSFDGRELDDNEIRQILDTITECSDLDIVCVRSKEDAPETTQAQPEPSQPLYRTSKAPAAAESMIEEAQNVGVFYRGNIRSGQELYFDTSIIVLGDVNPGSVVVSAGNIIVLGALKGAVTAGSGGDRKAFVAALYMNPVQIQIADVLARCADSEDILHPAVKDYEPMMATVYEDTILIEPISRNVLKQIY